MSTPAHRGGHRTARPVDASMSLLNEVVARPVEPGYAAAAARRKAGAPSTRRWPVRATHLLLAAVLGLTTAGAIANLRQPQSPVVTSRELLAQEIAERSAVAEELAAANAELDAEIADLQADLISSANPGLLETLAQLELLTGAVAVSGPGLVLELRDAPGDDQTDVDPQSLVQDIDLQIAVNGLWAAGAEAIAINGHRLTGTSAVRAAGQAILVDLAPLIGPYRVEAIGDPRALQTAFARTSAANHLALLSGTYQIATSVRAADELQLPGAGSTTLRHAQVLADDVASSDKGGDG